MVRTATAPPTPDPLAELRQFAEVVARPADATTTLARSTDVLRTLAAATGVEARIVPGEAPVVVLSFPTSGAAVAHMFAADAARRQMQAAG